MKFKDQVIVVSGGGSVGESMSNGRATAIKFAREGGKVAVVDRKIASAEETVGMIKAEGGEAFAVAANVLKELEVQAMVAEVVAACGRIDVLFNNVGGGWGADVLNTSEADWDRTFNLNLKSILLVSKRVIPEMFKGGAGVIVNNSSAAAFIPDSMWAYNAAKAGVIKLTRDMAWQYGRRGIRVNCVVPGLIDSALGRLRVARAPEAEAERQQAALNKVPLGRQGTPWEVADAVLFLASREASYCNGACLVVDGGMTCG